MEIDGGVFLFNLSVLAMTFATVSVLVMLVRQSWGTRLSNFDIHLLVSYLSGAFVFAISGVVPPLVELFAQDKAFVWRCSSVVGAGFLFVFLMTIIRRRQRVVKGPSPSLVLVDFGLYGSAILILCISAAMLPLGGPGMYCLAFTICLGTLMWSFIRRIASLMGDNPETDWNPKKG